MEELIEVVFRNPFLLILLVGGIFSMLTGKPKENSEEEQSQRRETTDFPETFPVPHEQQQTSQQFEVETSDYYNNDSLSIEEQREQQMQRLTAQYATNNYEVDDEHSGLKDKAKLADIRREMEVEKVKAPYNKKFKKKFTKSLTKKGLINSVVMAEVLGSPRALKPYQSVPTRRRK